MPPKSALRPGAKLHHLQDDGTPVQAHLAYAIEDLGTPVVQYDVSYTFTRVGAPVTITGPMGDQSG